MTFDQFKIRLKNHRGDGSLSLETIGRYCMTLSALGACALIAWECAAGIISGFTNTERSQQATLPPKGEAGSAPEGPGWDANKPLMRRRTANEVPSPIGNTGGNTFAGSSTEGRARTRRDGTGRVNPPRGFLAWEKQTSEKSVGTLVAPTLAGIKPGLPANTFTVGTSGTSSGCVRTRSEIATHPAPRVSLPNSNGESLSVPARCVVHGDPANGITGLSEKGRMNQSDRD